MGLLRRPPFALRIAAPARLLAALLLLAAASAACKSSAPYTLPAAAVNTGLAAGFSALQRSQGGCYATCVGGTVCNTRTGFCDPIGSIVCLGMESDPPSCALRNGALMNTEATVPGGGAPKDFPAGLSPATGRPPPQPGGSGP